MKVDFARQQMVEQQVRAWDVLDADVLDILATTPREDFAPAAYRHLAFADTEIPLGHGETMMTPTLEGKLIQSLSLTPEDSVLEIGTGSGFVTACLARLAEKVTSIEIYEEFLDTAKDKLEQHAVSNVELVLMDGTQQLPGDTYDAIAVTGSVETFDPRFVEVLAPGGRMFIVVGKGPVMEARLITRSGEHDWSSDCLFETCLKPLVNATLPPQFSF